MAKRRSLLRTAGRAAVISGAATAASGRVARRQQLKFAPEEPPPRAHAKVRRSADGESDVVARLQQLAELHTSGALSAKEFTAAKAKLLGT
jgi:hypothetical protein